MLISPNALHLANEHNISLVGKLGSGKEGRILLKDVEKLIAEEGENEMERGLRLRAERLAARIQDAEAAMLSGPSARDLQSRVQSLLIARVRRGEKRPSAIPA